jgi:Zn ribbon nucleic-acid-binding protein
MSQKNKYGIHCPKCGEAQQVELFDSLNIGEDPSLKDDLLANKINVVACTGCEFNYRVDKNLLFHDPDNNLMIYLFNTPIEGVEAAQKEFLTTVQALNQAIPADVETPELHLVLSRTELVERIFLHETGLNDRIIEYIKCQIYANHLDEIPPQAKALLFNAEDSTADNLCFVVQHVESEKLEGMIEYRREAYDAYIEMFEKDDEVGNIFEMFPGPYISARALLLSREKANEG